MNEAQFACEGLNFGYFYGGSPIVHPDGEKAPAYTMAEVRRIAFENSGHAQYFEARGVQPRGVGAHT